jgi:menaquinone-specific isochorismate synthase
MEPVRGDEASVRTEPALAVRTADVEAVSARAFFDAARPANERAASGERVAEPRVVWRTPESGYVAACGVTATCETNGPDRFASVRERAHELFTTLETGPGFDPDADFDPDPDLDADSGSSDIDTDADVPYAARPRLFGGFSFFSDAHESPWQAVPDARFVLPAVQLVSTAEGTWLTVTGDRSTINSRLSDWRDRLASASEPGAGKSPAISHVERTTSRAAWYDQVETALSRIDGGSLRKVVLAQSLSATLDESIEVPEALSRLAGSYPECFVFSVPVDGGSRDFFGATPERLVSVRGREVETGALAGSVERGETDAVDARLARQLTESEKNDHEHALVANAVREQLAPLSRSVSVGDRTVRKLATVQHLFTPIEADLAGNEHVLSLVEALHPTPAVGGLPPDAAAETIREIETFDRGWYAAPVGWFDAAGDGTFAVAIRSAVAESETATLFAGNGIVAGSDPAEEWEEVQLKYRPVLDALGL